MKPVGTSGKEASFDKEDLDDLAHKAREQLRQGVDPIDARDGQRLAAKLAEQAQKAQQTRERWTLARWARDYHERVIEPSRTPRHAATWIASLENHLPAELWHAPIDSVQAMCGPSSMAAEEPPVVLGNRVSRGG